MKWFSLIIFGLFLNSSVMAATVWAPTDGDTNFLFTTTYTGSGILGLFDDQDQTYSGSHLLLSSNDLVSYTPTTGGYDAANLASGTLFLSDTYNFILGLTTDGGSSWITDTLMVDLGNNAYRIFFDGIGETVAVDVQAVPLPAAFWLFITGFLSLIGFSRRNKIRA